jgi:hypothetical protein
VRGYIIFLGVNLARNKNIRFNKSEKKFIKRCYNEYSMSDETLGEFLTRKLQSAIAYEDLKEMKRDEGDSGD